MSKKSFLRRSIVLIAIFALLFVSACVPCTASSPDVLFSSVLSRDLFSEGLSPASRNGKKWGFIDKKGKFQIKQQYEEVLSFSNGLAAIKLNGKWGYINPKGKSVIKPNFIEAGSFYENRAYVSYKDKSGKLRSGYINKRGRIVIKLRAIQSATNFCGKIAFVEQNRTWTCINRAGEKVIKRKFCNIGDAFYDGLIAVKVKKKSEKYWGFLNKKGELVIPCKYKDVDDFHEGLAAVRKENKWGFIDKTGKMVIQPQYKAVGVFSEGLASVNVKGKWGFINKSGEIVIAPTMQNSSFFSEGVACVDTGEEVGLKKPPYLANKYEVIDSGGKNVFTFDKAWEVIDFSFGRAVVCIDDYEYNYIDKQGNYLFEESFYYATDSFNDGYAIVLTYDETLNVIDKYGNFMFKKGFKGLSNENADFILNATTGLCGT